jgi:hypothetical protein
MLKIPILKVDLNKIFKNASTCTKCQVLQNGLHVNKLLIEKINGTSKNIYVLSNYTCYNQTVLKF